MNIDDARRFHLNSLDVISMTTQGIEGVLRAVEVFNARGGEAGFQALKHPNPSTPEEEAENAEIDQILSDIAALAPVATALNNLFTNTNRRTMMRLRRDL